ncbi:MAG TPA: hypothetical protein DIV54_03540, partial [Verrucomicrobiales bacterium]|nr:hypothetical protein [Verrucomicrobiales bacterium]
MRKLVDRSQFIAVFLSCFCSVGLKADTIPLIGPPVEARTVFPFSVGQVVHPVVAKLPTPDFVDEIVSIPMAISSGSPLASRHVLQGLAHIQAAWDFEAYRHFCEALKLDPDCLMAYWGIGLALAAPNNEFTQQRQVAVMRMIELIDATREVQGKQVPIATKMEQQYALAL